MHWQNVPFTLWLVAAIHYIKKVIGLTPNAIQSNWVYFLRLALPLGYIVKHINGKIHIKHPETNLVAVLRIHSSDILVFIQIFFSGEYNSLHKLKLVKQPTIVDLGANVGLFTLFVKSRWSDAHIIAVEPEPENYKLIEEQIEINNFKNVEPMRAAVWIENKQLSIDIKNGEREWSYRVGEDENGTISGLTLNEIINDRKIDCIDLLKIDVEGSEVKLFKNKDFLLSLKTTVINLIMETHNTVDQINMIEQLRSLGFKTEIERELIIAFNEGRE